jgi:N utilization substance protein B
MTRHQAREAALQVLYFVHVAGVQPEVALEAFFAVHLPEADADTTAFVQALVRGTVAEVPAIDPVIAQHAEHWRIERLAIVDRLILRMAVWELRHYPETPPAVVLDEAVELARTFSTEASSGFVNGVLDAIRKAAGRPSPIEEGR